MALPVTHDGLCALLAQTFDHVQAQTYLRRAAKLGTHVAVIQAVLHINRQDLNAVTACILDQLAGAVKTHGLRVQQGRQKVLRVTRFQIGAEPGQFGETGRVTFRKTVFPKTADLIEQALGKFWRIFFGSHTIQQLLFKRAQTTTATPGRHGPSQGVRFVSRKTRRLHSQFHGLFLKNRHAQGAFQHMADFGSGVVNFAVVATAFQIRMHHAPLNGAGAHNGHLHHQVVKAFGTQPWQHAHLGAGLDLEHAYGVSAPYHPKGFGAVQRDVLQAEWFAFLLADTVQAATQGAQHT